MDWAQILVIILSIFFAIFLLLGIVLIALLIRITHQIKAATESTRRTIERIEHAVSGFAKVSTPLFWVRIIKKQLNKTKQAHKGGDDV